MAPDASDALAVRQNVQNLFNAAKEGKTEICKYLLEDLKLDVDAKDENGETPLLHAARQGHVDTVKYLVDCGANTAAFSDLGATALHHAPGIGNIELLPYLHSKGVDVESQSDVGAPLIWAAGHASQNVHEVPRPDFSSVDKAGVTNNQALETYRREVMMLPEELQFMHREILSRPLLRANYLPRRVKSLNDIPKYGKGFVQNDSDSDGEEIGELVREEGYSCWQ